MELKAVIIEDEADIRVGLENMLTQFCEGVRVVAAVDRVQKGVKAIQEWNPELVFLDIELPMENGFSLFTYFPDPCFDVIFTTAYAQYALQAFKLSAIDYLLKPIDLDDLRQAIASVRQQQVLQLSKQKLEVLQNNLNTRQQKLILPLRDGYSFVQLEEIVYCEAQSNYTLFHLCDQEPILVSKTLKLYNELLVPFHFFRISRSFLININHIKKYGRSKTPVLTMSNGALLPVSVHRKEELMEVLNG
ncbi:MAG: LytTR family DNA-binding domain-containing protein [Bacteroidota bacterium]